MKTTWCGDNEYSQMCENAEWQDRLAGPRSLVQLRLCWLCSGGSCFGCSGLMGRWRGFSERRAMTAEKIRAEFLSCAPKGSLEGDRLFPLYEIAAQLAELNQQLREQAEAGKQSLAQINEAVESMKDKVNQL